MLRQILRVALGLALAILAAMAAGSYFGLPLVLAPSAFEPPIWPLARALVPFLPLLLILSLSAIAAAEARGWRHWLFWTLTGGSIAAFGYFALRGGGASAAMIGGNAPLKFGAMGAIGGLLYWLTAGRASGELPAEAARLFGPGPRSDRDERRRCAWCSAVFGLAGLLPLALLGWHGFYRNGEGLAQEIKHHGEDAAARLLAASGLPDLKLKVDGHIGHLVGTVADVAAKTRAREQAQRILAPMVGVPGIVAILQDDLIARDDADPKVAAENTRIRAAMEAVRLAAELDAKRKAEAQARRKAEDEARVAAEAKRKAEEEARKKAENDARLAAEAKRKAEEEARRKAEEEARLAAEAKRKAEEDARKKAESDARVAAETKRKMEEEARRKSEDDARNAAEAKRKAEGDARAKAEDDKRLAAAAEASRKAEAERRKADDERAERLRSVTVACGQKLEAVAYLKFRSNAADLRKRHSASLDRLSEVAKECTELTLVIRGHADASGSPDSNQRLSEERAETVRAALVERGVDSKHLETQAFAARQPVDGAYKDFAVARNRRVDFVFSQSAPVPEPAP